MGTDFLSPRTQTDMAKAKVNQVHYDQYQLHDMVADAQVANGEFMPKLDSRNDLLNGNIAVDAPGWVPRKQATLVADVRHADMYQLKITDKPVDVSLYVVRSMFIPT